jgi:hypothetical protein
MQQGGHMAMAFSLRRGPWPFAYGGGHGKEQKEEKEQEEQ